jgi:hypothetical protein
MNKTGTARVVLAASAVALALAGCSRGHDEHADRGLDRLRDEIDTTAVSASSPAPTSASTAAASASLGTSTGAASPRAAVEQFLRAEINGDLGGSFAVLADDQRKDLGDEAAWEAAHVDLPHYTSFSVRGEGSIEGNQSTVATDVTLVPGLDTINGLTPGHATIMWSLIRSATGWTVDLDQSKLEPIYPNDSGATTAARTWLDDRRACRATDDRVDDPDVTQALCHASGMFDVGTPSALPQNADGQQIIAAYGADATSWARIVPVSGPSNFHLVTAPIGDTWEVIAVTA